MILKRGSQGCSVELLQEQLIFQEYHLKIDGDFGGKTQAMVMAYQRAHNLPATGEADNQTTKLLTAPIKRATVATVRGRYLAETVLIAAGQHLKERPREIGGDNRGFWARYYLDGKEDLPWCAGFVSIILEQATESHNLKVPYGPTLSCDILAVQGKRKKALFKYPHKRLGPGAIFLLRKTEGDWVHTGFVTHFSEKYFCTIEGNTNEGGSREGYKVCARIRKNYERYDFIAL